MIISTMKGKPCSVLFIVFNLLIFWAFRYFVLGNVGVNMSLISIYSMFILIALITTFMYILIDLYIKYRFRKKAVDNYTNIEEYNSGSLGVFDTLCILKVKQNMSETYKDTELYHSNREKYMKNLHSRYETLNTREKLYIYFFEYINVVIMSVLIFIAWVSCYDINFLSSILYHISVLLGIAATLIFSYYIITNICLKVITNVIKKRGLQFFVCR